MHLLQDLMLISDGVVVVSPRTHLWEFLQFGITRFCWSIEQGTGHNVSVKKGRWLNNKLQFSAADGCHQIINCLKITLNSGIINISSVQSVVSSNYLQEEVYSPDR